MKATLVQEVLKWMMDLLFMMKHYCDCFNVHMCIIVQHPQHYKQYTVKTIQGIMYIQLN